MPTCKVNQLRLTRSVIPEELGKGSIFNMQFTHLLRVTLFAAHVFALGCLEQKTAPQPPSPPPAAEASPTAADNSSDADIYRLLQESAAAELRTLQIGLRTDEKRTALAQPRLKFLEQTIQGVRTTWTDDNTTREGCLTLEAQLTALAIGRGFAGTAAEVRNRMKRLQSLLNAAGYRFDDRGFERPYDSDGQPIKDYVPLLNE